MRLGIFIPRTIEKARKGEAVGGKYLYRIATNEKGKNKANWKYVYNDDVKKPNTVLELLKNIFNIGRAKLEKQYVEDKIATDYEVTQSTYNQHVLEYFGRKHFWDNIFSKKENRDIAKKPMKQATVEKKEKAKVEQAKKEKKPVEKKAFTINKTLMRKVWLRFSNSEEAKQERESEIQNVVDNAIENVEDKENILGGGNGTRGKLREQLKENLKPLFMKPIKNKSTGIEAHISGQSVNKMSSDKAIEKSKNNGFTVEQHFEVCNNIVSLFENADLVKVQNDKNGSLNLVAIKRFECLTKLKNGESVNAFITVKESVEQGHKIYSVELLDINKASNNADALGTSESKDSSIHFVDSDNSNIPQNTDLSSDLDEHENRSQAMLGNDNAKKPFTNEELAKEEFNTLNVREEKGLDPIGKNIGERVSAMEDTISLNPNSENYAYKDTGYIGGSQKEKIANFWKRKAELGETVDATEIDWNALEENPRYAEKMITKENILGKINYAEMKENNVDPRVAFLISKIYSSIGKAPVGKTEEARKNYVQGINTVVARLKECKTIDDIDNFVKDIDGEYTQYFTNQLSKIPELQQIAARLAEVRKKSTEINRKLNDYLGELDKQKKTLKEKKALINEYARKIAPGFENDIDIVSTRIRGDSYSSLKYFYPFFEEERQKIITERRKIRAKYQAELELVNTQKEQWKQLGEKFYNLTNSNSFNNHLKALSVYDKDKSSYNYGFRNTDYDKYTTWDWVDTKPKEEKSEIITKLKKRKFEMIVPKTLERVGGRDVSVKTTQELKEKFNLRDVQSGTYVLTDPVSAKWHVDNIATGFADLVDVTGIPDNLISLNGRIAIAIGARGHGKHLAHYESVERVINITKMKGGGSLGHEWFHAFDNLIAEAMNGGNYNKWLTGSDDVIYTELPNNETNTQVKNAFKNLVKAIMEGDTPETQIVEYSKDDYEKAQRLKKDKNYYSRFPSSLLGKIVLSNSLAEAVDAVNKKMGFAYFAAKEHPKKALYKYQKKAIREYESWIKTAVAYFDDKPEGNEVSVLTGRTVSRFYEDAKKLDKGKGAPYWSTTIEMAARAFEAYLVDKLKATGRKNDYLSGHANNDEYSGMWYPYPTEKDRIKINAAFDELFNVVKQHNAIQKALKSEILEKTFYDESESELICKAIALTEWYLDKSFPIGSVKKWKNGERFVKVGIADWQSERTLEKARKKGIGETSIHKDGSKWRKVAENEWKEETEGNKQSDSNPDDKTINDIAEKISESDKITFKDNGTIIRGGKVISKGKDGIRVIKNGKPYEVEWKNIKSVEKKDKEEKSTESNSSQLTTGKNTDNLKEIEQGATEYDTERIPRQAESSYTGMADNGRSRENGQNISKEGFTSSDRQWICGCGGHSGRVRIERLYKNNVAEIKDKVWFASRLDELKKDSSTKKAFSVSSITEEDLKDCRLFTIDGNALCAVRKDGYLMSVVKPSRFDKIKMHNLLEVAKEQGATHLECYEHLVEYYERQGFEVTETYDFDPELALDGVDYDKEFPQYKGKPRYFEMKLNTEAKNDRQIQSNHTRMADDGRSRENEEDISKDPVNANRGQLYWSGGHCDRTEIKQFFRNDVVEVTSKEWFASRVNELKKTIERGFAVSSIDDLKDLDDCRLFTIKGIAVCAVRKDGYLQSVVKSGDHKVAMYHLLEVAKEQGATHLECYEHLVEYYERQGFEVTETYDFDPELALDGVDYDKEFPQYKGKPRYFEMNLFNKLNKSVRYAKLRKAFNEYMELRNMLESLEKLKQLVG